VSSTAAAQASRAVSMARTSMRRVIPAYFKLSSRRSPARAGL
jgi:hypothetical protein